MVFMRRFLVAGYSGQHGKISGPKRKKLPRALKGRTISRAYPSHCFHVLSLSDQSKIKATEWQKAAGDQS